MSIEFFTLGPTAIQIYEAGEQNEWFMDRLRQMQMG
ncbi:hypothetical protein BN997_02581 [Oceanobacillus oncorhynchi]|uniref:Uncharacterized protein n=1 Tax=Oceanobacillus oncorhynchi TaxID=545501 RepID=A0A0A1MUU7_9BACI|nr:hypothetical protein BN997_02581 [Oceanobacillus oncorhynchi]